jgi:hypothetical protein
MTVAQTRSVIHNAKPPLRWSATGAVTETIGADGYATEQPDGLILHSRCPASTELCPCLTTFIRDRQRMLRSWRALQRAFPPSDLAAEADATVSAMRQLHQLETEVQCHEQG